MYGEKINTDVKWLPKLDKEYCKNAKPKSNKITPKTLRKYYLT